MRARNLKPGFFKNDELAECKPLARLLFEGLWCYADKEGRFKWRPKQIKAEILPYDSCNIDDLLLELAKRLFIIPYRVNGNLYGFIPTFLNHQSPHPKEKDQGIPEPTKDSLDFMKFPEISEKGAEAYIHNILITEYQDSKKKKPRRGESEGGNKPDKVQYAEMVKMTEDQHGKLVSQFGEANAKRMIEVLNNAKASKGYKYKSDYHAILSWVVEKVAKSAPEAKHAGILEWLRRRQANDKG